MASVETESKIVSAQKLIKVQKYFRDKLLNKFRLMMTAIAYDEVANLWPYTTLL